MKQKYIILVDGNNFFASCEQMINPALKNRAVCVLSNNDGCVIARSNEAKKMGIPMGIPYFMAKKNFTDVVYLSSNFALYHEISSRMMQLLSNYSDIVDVYSIDEAFLDVTGLDKIFKMTYYELALKIKNDIEDKIGINVSVGLAPTKILAKLASHRAKKGTGVYYIRHHLTNEEIENVKIEDLWGIGRNIARSLRKYGIFYAHEILLQEDEFYKRIFGKKGLELKYELMGYSVIPFTQEGVKPKSIQRTRAFPEFSQDKDYIKTELTIHLNNVCKKLRSNNLNANYIAVMLRTKDFKVYYREAKLNNPSNSEFELMNIVKSLFSDIYRKGVVYRSSGVHAYYLTDTEKLQLTLFDDKSGEKGGELPSIIDKLEDKYGKGIISIGDTGIKSIIKKHTREKIVTPFS